MSKKLLFSFSILLILGTSNLGLASWKRITLRECGLHIALLGSILAVLRPFVADTTTSPPRPTRACAVCFRAGSTLGNWTPELPPQPQPQIAAASFKSDLADLAHYVAYDHYNSTTVGQHWEMVYRYSSLPGIQSRLRSLNVKPEPAAIRTCLCGPDGPALFEASMIELISYESKKAEEAGLFSLWLRLQRESRDRRAIHVMVSRLWNRTWQPQYDEINFQLDNAVGWTLYQALPLTDPRRQQLDRNPQIAAISLFFSVREKMLKEGGTFGEVMETSYGISRESLLKVFARSLKPLRE